ncbi:hypothetical protein D1872_299500 [compost metagenome]
MSHAGYGKSKHGPQYNGTCRGQNRNVHAVPEIRTDLGVDPGFHVIAEHPVGRQTERMECDLIVILFE